MKIIVDTNRIIAALIRDSASRKILFSDKFNFLTVSVTKFEIEEHKQEILEKARIGEDEFDKIFSLLFSKIFVVGDAAIESKMEEAKQIMDKIDSADTPFVALALAMETDGIWTNDNHFGQQVAVKIWKTDVLLRLLDENYSY
ncbi:hypothetical protein HYU12_02470 [Candidatus Woesearchaeota archaeon]|nr:hypothetical protein [Candidatus Woesearchaeota archaeon]